ncbi:MAG: DNA replication/repair protein RecF [Halobacteriovoraceae bacterium]|nr:DNA replication/repair protein RecF [Halobacteriovoraceae bacterium]
MSLKINKICVQNFRNLTDSTIEFSENINCIFGKNGNGKTNILEAIFYLSHGKSFRKKSSFPQILSIDCEKPELIISSVFSDKNDLKAYSYRQSKEFGHYFLAGKTARKKLKIPVVFINPIDSQLFHTTPSVRRDWFNTYFSLLSDEYKKTLKDYNDCLKFRNSLLSNRPYKFESQIRANDIKFVTLSYQLKQLRLDYIEELNPYLRFNFAETFDSEYLLEIEYQTEFNTEHDLNHKLLNNLKKDISLGYSSYGVHKDDYVLQVNSMNAYEFCSLGQQKMSYLSLLFAYIELFRYKFKAYPIVLIDDVSGELDKLRWKKLIQYFSTKNYQVIITTANENFRDELAEVGNVKNFIVEQGHTKVLN